MLPAWVTAPLAADVRIDAPTQGAINRALEWLASKQNEDGSWSESRYPHNTAITAFALLAFMSQGHLPNEGLYGPEIAKGVRFLVTSGREKDGYLIGTRGGNNYCHAMATLALAELWGMTGDLEIRPVLQRAVDLIVGCQNPEGGWRYEPVPTKGADVSVTIMQVMALRAAKNGGMHVPDETLQRAIGYVQSCYVPKAGGFKYRPQEPEPGFARTAAGICVLQLSGKYDAEQIPKAVEYLRKNFHTRMHFFYGHYYAAHAMHQVGGEAWESWYNDIRNVLASKQGTAGDWSIRDLDHASAGPVYQTAIAVIVLSVPAGYLPIFQR